MVWTLKDGAILHILPNPEFWSAHLQKKQQFFTAVSLSELVAQYYTKPVSQASVSNITLPLKEKEQNTLKKKKRGKKNSGVCVMDQNIMVTWWHVIMKTVKSSGFI